MTAPINRTAPAPQIMGSIVPGNNLEVCYRFTVPLPVRVTVNGKPWEFALRKPDYPPYFSLQVTQIDSRGYYMPATYDTNEQAESRPYQEIRLSYPNVLVRFFEQLVGEGRAECVKGVHHPLYYRNSILSLLVSQRAKELEQQLSASREISTD